MNFIRIGIIDEDNDERSDIQRTIIINRPKDIPEDYIDFKEYVLPQNTDKLVEEVARSVIEDIISGLIHILIVDYRIIVEKICVEGTEIFEIITSLVPKFPTIILTNVPEDCYTKSYVDADKVYAKSEFFKVDENYSKEKTLNIFRNIENYKNQRARFTSTLTEQLYKLETQGYTPDIYQAIIDIENALDDYTPQGQTFIEKELNLSDLKVAVDLLQEASRLLGDTDED